MQAVGLSGSFILSVKHVLRTSVLPSVELSKGYFSHNDHFHITFTVVCMS